MTTLRILPPDPGPIGFLVSVVSPGKDTAWFVVGSECGCADKRDHGSAVYRINIIPYSQHCCECGKELVKGGSIRDLFDGT
jgi:hypothetical protein